MADKGRFAGGWRRLRWRLGGGASSVRGTHLDLLDSLEWSRPFRSFEYTALDCEMTGLDPARDEILSIGAVRVRESRLLMHERFYHVFKPEEAVSPREVILIHGLGPTELSRGKPLAQMLEELLRFLGDSVVLGHFAEIDLEFLNRSLVRHTGRRLQNPVLDTRRLYAWWRQAKARTPAEVPEDERLEAIVTTLKLPRFPAHHAFYDAASAGLLFLKLLDDFEASGALTFSALFRECGVY
jgi:DNA polymerase-3 subunit epsilon